MTKKTKRRLLWVSGGVLVLVAGLGVAAYILAERFEPYVREQTVGYLTRKFDADVSFEGFDVRMPLGSPIDIALRKGRGAWVHVKGRDLSIRPKNLGGTPLFSIKSFAFQVDLGSLWQAPTIVRRVDLKGMVINLPPKGQRPSLSMKDKSAPPAEPAEPTPPPTAPSQPSVIIEDITADGTQYSMLPKDADKAPLVFDIRKLKLTNAGPGIPMKYDAEVHIPKPPGLVKAKGSFGPWNTPQPSSTPLDGKYTFDNADLGVFKGIAGTLSSVGEFRGVLNELTVDGDTQTPDFRLKSANNRVPLTTKYHAIVDGTNGNTLLEPVIATLGNTTFDCRGGVIRYTDAKGKTVDLKVKLIKGRIDDLLKLAVKGDRPIMRGGVSLDMKFTLPPGKAPIEDKLIISGAFKLDKASFTSDTIQKKLDDMSRRAQGKPNEEELVDLPVDMAGKFDIANGVIKFPELNFKVPGAMVDLQGKYTFRTEMLDFTGITRTQARLSQMMKTGWKRYALKPVDPFFAKEGYGTVIDIEITGTRDQPKFGKRSKK